MSSDPRPFAHLYGRRWRKARLRHLQQHPLCVMCQREGKTVAAEVVDHIKPHKGDLTLFHDPANFQSLCVSHHSGHKQSLEKGGKGRRAIGPDGYPL